MFYTGSLRGNLDGCACKKSPRSGLVKRASFIKNQKEYTDPVLVDTGDIVEPEPDTVLSSLILDSYRELGYSAVAIGDLEISQGERTLENWARKYSLQSNNLFIKENGKEVAISTEPITIRRDGGEMRILSVISPALLPEVIPGSTFSVKQPLEAVKAFVKDAEPASVRLLVVLYHGTVAEAEILARKVKEIDIIVVGHEQAFVDAKKIGSTLIVSSGDEGSWVGILQVTFRNGRVIKHSNRYKGFSYEQDPDDPVVRDRIVEYNALLQARLKE